MSTLFSMTDIMNAALTSQGMDEINPAEYPPEHSALSRNWPGIVEAELETGLYEFSRKEANLASRIEGKFGFDDGFAVPYDALHVRHLAGLNAQGERIKIDWTQDSGFVYVNCPDGVVVEYVVSAATHLWSANFARGVQFKLEAVLLRSVKEETREANQAEAQAEYYFERARTKASQSRDERPMYRSNLAARRFGHGRA